MEPSAEHCYHCRRYTWLRDTTGRLASLQLKFELSTFEWWLQFNQLFTHNSCCGLSTSYHQHSHLAILCMKHAEVCSWLYHRHISTLPNHLTFFHSYQFVGTEQIFVPFYVTSAIFSLCPYSHFVSSHLFTLSTTDTLPTATCELLSNLHELPIEYRTMKSSLALLYTSI